MDKLEKVNEAISKGTGDQFVTFTLEGEEYGVEILKVQEIIGYQGFTKVPNVPDFVKGVLNLRGSVVPVIDLRLKFSMKEKEYDKFTVILILEVKERIIGVIVDAVSDVVSLTEDDIQPTPDFSSGIRADFIASMGRKDDKLIIILDIDKVLSESELEVLEAA
ncbi:MAG: chemotaxis protein CheW [Firmicutes bacterium]|nr:chemotaxis protein CheW [Bacillota bacterium]